MNNLFQVFWTAFLAPSSKVLCTIPLQIVHLYIYGKIPVLVGVSFIVFSANLTFIWITHLNLRCIHSIAARRQSGAISHFLSSTIFKADCRFIPPNFHISFATNKGSAV